MVWFAGIPSGSLDLISVKTLTLIRNCKLCICANSLLNNKMLGYCGKVLLLKNNYKCQIEQIIYLILCCKGLVIKLHSGCVFGYSGFNEIIFYLNILGISFAVIPSIGVIDTVFSYLGWEFDSVINKSIIIVRLTKQTLVDGKLVCGRGLLEIHPILVAYLTTRLVPYVVKLLSQIFGNFCPIICVCKSSWRMETYLLTNISHLINDIKRLSMLRMTLVIVGRSILISRKMKCKLTN